MRSKREVWRGHVAGWHSEGLSQSAYCWKHGLSQASFGYWRRKLDGERALAGPGVIPIVSAPQADASVRIQLPGGVWLEAPPAAAPEHVAALVRALSAC